MSAPTRSVQGGGGLPLTLGSLFSGIGGLELGFERTGGFVTRWQVENDPYAVKVLTKHWPEVPKYGDITQLDPARLERVDVIVGGFPCQDTSVAGKRAGLSGSRSGLWSEYIRIVRALRPRYVCVENTPGLLYPIKRDGRLIEPAPISRVLGDLAACGYDADGDVLSASLFGAWHRRDRVFIIAYANGHERDERGNQQQESGKEARYLAHPDSARLATLRNTSGVQPTPSEGSSAIIERGDSSQSVPNSAGGGWAERQWPTLRQSGYASILSGGTRRTGRSEYFAVEPDVGRVANGVPRRVDRLRGLGNAVVPQVAQYVAECILQHAEATRP